ncbi:hypothetical protein ACFODL_20145 [Phenylobacterium terrae]|uniref:DUF2283 domain-containing protein n=1 Tax=Phenylobacterium terrae TaxID=2665495 RepID=A0ABW4MZV0_9CAUL
MSRTPPPGPGAARGAEAGPMLYTFDCRRADGSPVCFEAHELGSDARALALARRLLAEHLTCASVEVFDGERLVGAVSRERRLADTLLPDDGRTA